MVRLHMANSRGLDSQLLKHIAVGLSAEACGERARTEEFSGFAHGLQEFVVVTHDNSIERPLFFPRCIRKGDASSWPLGPCIPHFSRRAVGSRSGPREHAIGPATVGKKSMKIVILAVVSLASLALAASLVVPVTAAPLMNKKHAHRQHTMTKPPARTQQGGSDYYEHVLDKVPFGSQRWWDIYQAQQGRGGG
jgi:hypothetical protein